MLPQEMLNEVILIGHAVMVCGEIMAIAHHGLEPCGLAVKILYRGDLAAEHAVISVLLQLAGKHQTGAVEGEDVEVIDQYGYAHALAEHLYGLNVGERTGAHAKSDDVQ